MKTLYFITTNSKSIIYKINSIHKDVKTILKKPEFVSKQNGVQRTFSLVFIFAQQNIIFYKLHAKGTNTNF